MSHKCDILSARNVLAIICVHIFIVYMYMRMQYKMYQLSLFSTIYIILLLLGERERAPHL